MSRTIEKKRSASHMVFIITYWLFIKLYCFLICGSWQDLCGDSESRSRVFASVCRNSMCPAKVEISQIQVTNRWKCTYDCLQIFRWTKRLYQQKGLWGGSNGLKVTSPSSKLWVQHLPYQPYTTPPGTLPTSICYCRQRLTWIQNYPLYPTPHQYSHFAYL